ncbi:MAG TPA: hypothetical protein VK604_27375 [Bryobacteraceae bacterium]|nr:hypothetical protein [Bryobacteraceae bacterium]
MVSVHEGQCGICTHFGEGHADKILAQIRATKEAAETFVDDCGHPKLVPLHLKVTAVSGCDGFEPVTH